MTMKKKIGDAGAGEKVTVGESVEATVNASLQAGPLLRKIATVCMPCGLVLDVREEGRPRPDVPNEHASPEDPTHKHPIVVVEYDAHTVKVREDKSNGTYAVQGRPLE